MNSFLLAARFDAVCFLSVSLQAFRWFLRSEFSEENLNFWLSCEEYKLMPESKLSSKAQSISSQFINPDAPQEVRTDQLPQNIVPPLFLIQLKWAESVMD